MSRWDVIVGSRPEYLGRSHPVSVKAETAHLCLRSETSAFQFKESALALMVLLREAGRHPPPPPPPHLQKCCRPQNGPQTSNNIEPFKPFKPFKTLQNTSKHFKPFKPVLHPSNPSTSPKPRGIHARLEVTLHQLLRLLLDLPPPEFWGLGFRV